MLKIAILPNGSNVVAAPRSVSGDYVQCPQLTDCLCAFAASPSATIRTKPWHDELSAHRHAGLGRLPSSTAFRNGGVPGTSAELGLLRSRTTGQPFRWPLLDRFRVGYSSCGISPQVQITCRPSTFSAAKIT